MNIELFDKLTAAIETEDGSVIRSILLKENHTDASNVLIRFNENEICTILSMILLTCIPDICHFWYTTIFLMPLKGTPKKVRKFTKKCLATKEDKCSFWHTSC